MSHQAKSERLMNLVICLLVARGYVPKSHIRQVVGGYGDQSDEAFERMFERDKEELREVGIPIETGSQDPFGDEEPGYRIRRQRFELPDVHLEPDEVAAVGLASRVWQHSSLAQAASSAAVKLQAAGVDSDTSALAPVEPRVSGGEASFWPLWEAVRDRRPVTFTYQAVPGGDRMTRHLQPWSVLSYHGRWYVVGHDTDRDAPRLFRLSRIVDEVRPTGRRHSYDVPDGETIRAATASLAPTPRQERTARVLVRKDAGHGLRRWSVRVSPAADRPGWDDLTFTFVSFDGLCDELVSLGSAVVVLEPADVRMRVIARLQDVVAT